MKNTTEAKSSVSAFLRSREGIKWPLIDQAFDKFGGALFESAAAAGAGAATGGAVGGPLGAAFGSAAGIVIGRLMYAMAVESDRVLAKAKYGDAIVTILEKAFEDELMCFSLCKEISLSGEVKSRRDRLAQLEVKIEHQAFGQLSDSEIYYGLEKANMIQLCKQLGTITIRVSVPAIHPATISTLLLMNKYINKYTESYSTIEIDFSAGLGVELLHNLSTSAHPDFIFVADSPFYQWEDRKLQRAFQPALPVSCTPDLILGRRANTGDPNSRRRVLYQPGTSAHDVATWATKKLEIGEKTALSKTMDSIKAPWNALNNDEAMAVIAPYTHLVLGDNKFGIIGDKFQSPISLFAKHDWFRPSLEVYRNSFSNLFIFSWKELQANPAYGVRILLRNKEFMEYFCKYLK